MYLNELLAGERVFLEMRKDSSVYEVVTTVVGTAQGEERQALLQPFVYKGKVMDLGNQGVDNVVFSLYTVNENKERIGWSNVRIRMIDYKGNKFYAATSQKFHEISDTAERRDNKRIQIDRPATMLDRSENKSYQVTVLNISDTGIAFVTQDDIVLVNRHCRLTFHDEINGSDYELVVDAICIRKERMYNKGYLYGCEVMEASHQVLAYVYIKKIMEQYNQRKI
ncbi:PilZ domain-containing protein [Eubacterium oxidoreducens]|uniref:PilZ domain-containing protein n=1 Tax=Eubacterium oxidoreducens TaxID=1732 RepID=A0A1G6CQK4_EUBOX|nr:PilZ domain-containing protein [Eubacterium oxidoreducens]SDB35170.1 PilZ domain-containing protein [Eubacterium oxidoreducens]